MAKKAIVLIANGAEDIEVVTIVDVLRRGGIHVTLISVQEQTVTCANRVTITADATEIPTNHDALILPGGSTAAQTFSSLQSVQSAIKKYFAENKLVAAICASPMALGSAGVLTGKRATCYPSLESHLTGAIVVKDEQVVIDGNIVTSQGPGTAMNFACRLVGILVDHSMESNVRKQLLFL